MNEQEFLSQFDAGNKSSSGAMSEKAFLSQLGSAPMDEKSAGKGGDLWGSIKEYYNYLHEPTEKPKNSKDFWTRVVPESVSKTTVGALEFIPKLINQTSETFGNALDLATSGHIDEANEQLKKVPHETIEGIARFAGEPFGVFGSKAFKDKWSTDPAGALLGVASIISPVLRKAKVKAGVAEEFRDLSKSAEEVKTTPEAKPMSAGEFIKQFDDTPKVEPTPPEIVQPGATSAVEGLPTGPGAQTKGAIGETPSDIIELSQSLKEIKSPSLTLKERVSNAASVSDRISTAKDVLGKGIDRLKLMGQTLFDDVKKGDIGKPKERTSFEVARDDYVGAYQTTNFEAKRFGAEVRKQISDPSRREAVINFIQADGDMTVLKNRYDQSLANPKTKKFAKGYETAMNLTGGEKVFAENVKNYFDSKLQKGIDAGLLKGGISDYVNQVWAKENPVGNRLKTDVGGGLQTNPSMIRKRIFDSYFEGEQAGFTPRSKDIGSLITLYDQTFNKAIAARNFVKSLHEMNASDGSPLITISGAAKIIKGETGQTNAYAIRSRTKPDIMEDVGAKGNLPEGLKATSSGDKYKVIDHPALRDFKWVFNDSEGKPVYLQGDALVHPEAFTKLNNLLKTSAIKESPIGRAALKTVATLKGTLLSLSGFHQVQVGLHAIFHGVNPFNTPKIDLSVPIQRALVDHGTIIADYKNMEMFHEGLTSGGLIAKTPGLGKLMQKYTDFLFTDYIPKLKMKMATEAYARNSKRYEGKLSNDQILSLTSDQANAAFGELNYAKLGRNPTTQDAMRLLLLAPDFLEARARFAAQSLRPYSGINKDFRPTVNEQGMAAMIRGGLGLYVGCRIVNGILNDGDTHTDRPFSVIINGNEFVPRTVMGDVFHLINDPNSFVYHRLNPVTTTPFMKAVTKRDASGRYMDAEAFVTDFFKSFVPIPFQGWTKGEVKIWQSVLGAMGISSFQYKTNFERALAEESSKHMTVTSTKDDRARYTLVSKYADDKQKAMRDGKPDEYTTIDDKINQDIIDGKLYGEDKEKIEKYVNTNRVERYMKGDLPAETILKVWDKATSDEQMTYRPILEKKIATLQEKHPEKYQKLQKEIENKLYGFDPSIYQQAKEAVAEKVEEVKNIPIREYRKWKEIGGDEPQK